MHDGQQQGAARVIWAVSSATVLSTLPVFLVAAQSIHIRRDLYFDEAALGLAIAGFFLSGALASLPAGQLVERVGASGAIRAAAGGTLAALMILAQAKSWSAIAAGLCLAGVCHGLTQPATSLALAARVPLRRQGIAFGIKHAAVPVATLLAGLALPLVALTLGWRWSFPMAATLTLVVIGLMPPGVRGSALPERPPSTLTLAIKPLLLLAAGAGAASAAANATSAFLVEAAVSAGTSEALAGLLLSIGGLASVIVRLVMGRRADRRGSGHILASTVMVGIGAIGSLTMAVAHLTPPNFAIVLVGAVLGLGFGWGWPGLFTFAVVRWNEDAPAAATGVTQTGLFVGAVIGPLLFGLASSRAGFAVAWSGAVVAAVVAVVIMVTARRVLLRRVWAGHGPARRDADGAAG